MLRENCPVAATLDGEIVGAGGELDVSRLAAVLGIEQPEGRDLVDLSQEDLVHKASPVPIIAQFSHKSKCFSPVDIRQTPHNT